MQPYLNIIKTVLKRGQKKDPSDIKTTAGRIGVPAISYFGYHYKIDLSQGFPILTTKKINYTLVLHELLWFLSGETHIRNLRKKTKIWDDWTSPQKNWSLGRTYGAQWVKWEQYLKKPNSNQYKIRHINQIQDIIDRLKNDPYSRRMVISAWNPADFERPKNDPKRTVQPSACHTLFMFYVTPDRKLCCHLTQRSGDVMLGIPFNIASYATLTQMLAQECGLKLGEFSHYINDCHIYENHIDGASEQLTRKPYPLPRLKIAKKPFWKLKFEDFKIVDYKHHPFIKFDIAV
ncbi:MAG: thymidylate synthase [Candidatus Jacksonbacteria bacterium]